MFSEVYSWAKSNQDQIFRILGKILLIVIAVLGVWALLRFISSLPGFNFDPFLTLFLILAFVQLNRIFLGFMNLVDTNAGLARKQIEILEKINKSLAEKEAKQTKRKKS